MIEVRLEADQENTYRLIVGTTVWQVFAPPSEAKLGFFELAERVRTWLAGGTPMPWIEAAIRAAGFEKQPPTWSASGLPAGLTIDPTTGVISGRVPSGRFVQIDVAYGNAAQTLVLSGA